MEEKLNDLYAKIYERCKKALPIEWSEIKFWTEKYEDEDGEEECWYYHEILNYRDKEGKWHRAAELKKEFSREALLQYSDYTPTAVIEEMYKVFDEAGMERFKVCEGDIYSDGRIEVRFQYEYSQGVNFIERMVLWEYETIGFTGNDYQKGIIKKYHPEFEYEE